MDLIGIPKSPREIPSFYFFLPVYRWIRLVCSFLGQALLHEAIFIVCLDSRRTLNCRNTKLPDYSQYIPRTYLVIIHIYLNKTASSHILYFRFIVPVSMIVCNDVMAYMFGFFFGRTPLIKLSPKKTWEGFIGGGVATVIFGLIVSQFHYKCNFKAEKLTLSNCSFLISCANIPISFAPSSSTKKLVR